MCMCPTRLSLSFFSVAQVSQRQCFERHHPHRGRAAHVNGLGVRHLGVLPASLSLPFRSRFCVMACVWHLSHVSVRARYSPPRESGLGLRRLQVWGVNGVCMCPTRLSLSFFSVAQESQRQCFERHHPHRGRAALNVSSVRLRHPSVLPTSLSLPFRSRLCVMACVCRLSHMRVRARYPPRGDRVWVFAVAAFGCVNGACACVPLGSPAFS